MPKVQSEKRRSVVLLLARQLRKSYSAQQIASAPFLYLSLRCYLPPEYLGALPGDEWRGINFSAGIPRRGRAVVYIETIF